jgi:thiol-disulfide isomerase/thioredoxin
MTKPRSWTDNLGAVVLVAVLAVLVLRLLNRGDGVAEPVAVGTPLPPFGVAGWLNLPDGEEVGAGGKIVVVDCFATWCGPCKDDLPHTAEVAADYRRRGVQFVSLTQETAEDLPKLNALIKDTPGFDWPVGYGAFDFMNALDVRFIPTVVLFGRDGKARWSGTGSYGLEAALDAALDEALGEALSEPAPASKPAGAEGKG